MKSKSKTSYYFFFLLPAVFTIAAVQLYKQATTISECPQARERPLPICHFIQAYPYVKWINGIGYFLHSKVGLSFQFDTQSFQENIRAVYNDREFSDIVFEGYEHQVAAFKHFSLSSSNLTYMTLLSRIVFHVLKQDGIELQRTVYQFHKMHRETKYIQIRKPLVILGMHRAGSTFLHRLMALDSGAKILPYWYTAANPFHNKTSEDYITEMRERFKTANFFSPDYFETVKRKHDIRPDLPEEDIALMMFVSPHLDLKNLFLFPRNSSFFQKFLHGETSASNKFSYLFLKRTLQMWASPENHLNSQVHYSHWLLKAPLHSLYLDLLLDEFPDARLVFLHRNFEDSLKSFIHLILLGYIPFQGEIIELREFSLSCLDLARGIIRRIMMFSMQGQDSSHIHLSFNQLMKDPMLVIKKIYFLFGMEFDSQLEDAILHQLMLEPAKNSSKKYTLEDFGLTKEDLETDDIKAYNKMFNVEG